MLKKTKVRPWSGPQYAMPSLVTGVMICMVLSGCQGYWGRTDSMSFHDGGRGYLRIQNATGGAIGASRANFEQLRDEGVKVIIDGWCSSACTLLLDERYDNVCWTDRAVFRFHAAVDGQAGPARGKAFPIGTAYLWNSYPLYVRELLPPQEKWRVDKWFEVEAEELPDDRLCR